MFYLLLLLQFYATVGAVASYFIDESFNKLYKACWWMSALHCANRLCLMFLVGQNLLDEIWLVIDAGRRKNRRRDLPDFIAIVTKIMWEGRETLDKSGN